MQSFVTQSIARIRAFRLAKGWTINRMAREAGLTESSIRNMDRPDWNPESRTLERLEATILKTKPDEAA